MEVASATHEPPLARKLESIQRAEGEMGNSRSLFRAR